MKITNALKLALKSLLSLRFGSVITDKAELIWDGEDDLKIGDEVYVRGGDPEDNAELQPAPDGEYTVEDGKVIKVVEGKVAEIVDPEAEVAGEPVEEVAQEENGDVTPAEEAENEPAEDESVEDRLAALEGRLAEFTEGLNAIINSIAALEERIAGVEGKLAKVEEPAADPVDETPEVEQNSHKTRLSWLRKD